MRSVRNYGARLRMFRPNARLYLANVVIAGVAAVHIVDGPVLGVLLAKIDPDSRERQMAERRATRMTLSVLRAAWHVRFSPGIDRRLLHRAFGTLITPCVDELADAILVEAVHLIQPAPRGQRDGRVPVLSWDDGHLPAIVIVEDVP